MPSNPATPGYPLLCSHCGRWTRYWLALLIPRLSIDLSLVGLQTSCRCLTPRAAYRLHGHPCPDHRRDPTCHPSLLSSSSASAERPFSVSRPQPRPRIHSKTCLRPATRRSRPPSRRVVHRPVPHYEERWPPLALSKPTHRHGDDDLQCRAPTPTIPVQVTRLCPGRRSTVTLSTSFTHTYAHLPDARIVRAPPPGAPWPRLRCLGPP